MAAPPACWTTSRQTSESPPGSSSPPDTLVGHGCGDDGRVVLRFTGEPAIEASVRELASFEQNCCSFFDTTVTRDDGEVVLDATASGPLLRARSSVIDGRSSHWTPLPWVRPSLPRLMSPRSSAVVTAAVRSVTSSLR